MLLLLEFSLQDFSFVFFLLGPRLDLDPDLVAAMDEDFDFEDPDNELEDDFILIAQDETDHRWASFTLGYFIVSTKVYRGRGQNCR